MDTNAEIEIEAQDKREGMTLADIHTYAALMMKMGYDHQTPVRIVAGMRGQIKTMRVKGVMEGKG